VSAQAPRFGAALLGAGAVALPAFDQGGIFPLAWGRNALGLLIAGGVALGFRRRLEASRLGLALLGGLSAVLLWTALSNAWSASTPRTVDEVERTLIYVALVAAVLFGVSRETYPYLLGGALAALCAVAIDALRIGPPEGQSLSGPVGYWNALGILCAIGIMLALGFASTALPLVARVGALATLPLLGTTLYQTHSRGAVLGLGAALLFFAFFHPLLAGSRRSIAAAVALLAAAVLVAAVVHAGGPSKLLGRSYSAFNSPAAPNGQPRQELLTFSGSFRSDYWRVAWHEYRAHPLGGTGAGTFDLYWTRNRKTIYGARDAHNLYLETLAELGPIGLLLLLATFAVPFVGLRRAGKEPLAAAAAGAYLAFLVHAGVDWDWEIPAVTITGLLCGTAVVVAAGQTQALPRLTRPAALGALVPLALFAFIVQVGNTSLQQSQDLAGRRDYAGAAQRAERATHWLPWSSAAWRLKGEAESQLGYTPAARESYLKGLRKDPREWQLWYDLARVSHGAARRRAVERAEELNPYSREVRGLLGVQGRQ
jgi:O-Antigen ligase